MKRATPMLGVLLSLSSGCSGGSSGAADPGGSTEATEGTEDPTGGTEGDTTDEGEAAPERTPVITGGWGEGDVHEAGPRDAAAFAVREQARLSGDTIELVSIAWVSQQVVSGMNYRLGLNITRNGTTEQATAVVYSQPWTSTTQLTSWTPGLVR